MTMENEQELSNVDLSASLSCVQHDNFVDQLLDELPIPQQPESTISESSNFEQLFEEVSLDLPQQNKKPVRPKSRTSQDMITSNDISGPFFSISDVLDDSTQHNPKAARRNVNEADVIVTAGGTSLPVKSGLNIFKRSKTVNQKPTPLETVISKTRPRMLPPKDPQEEKKHLQEYQAMMKKAKKLEHKKQKENDRKREQKDKRVIQAVSIWEKQIIPNWKSTVTDKKIITLWEQGIPHRCRKKVWTLRIGNELNVSKNTFTDCLAHLPYSTTHIAQDHSIYSTRKRRTSSMDVLREYRQKESGTEDGEEEEDDEIQQFSDLSFTSSSHSLDSSTNEGSSTHDESNEEDNQEEEDVHVTNQVLHDPTTINFLNKAIEDDILRTLPSLCVFQPDGPLFNSLSKILHAYVGFRSDTTYPRGASFLAGVLLLNMNSQDTFTSLVNLINSSQVLSALYNSDEKKIHGYFKIFNVIFAENLPKLYLHFKNLTLTPENYLPDWFRTIFASIVPLELSSRLWDIYLLYGDIVLFCTGIVVLKHLEPLLWGSGFSETVKILNMGFVGKDRGEQDKAAIAVSGHITEGDGFFNEILTQLDNARFKELLDTHMPKSL